MKRHTLTYLARTLRDAQRAVDKAQSDLVIAESEGRYVSDIWLDDAMERREEAIAAICALVDGDDATRGGA
jgi:hypothetical protein